LSYGELTDEMQRALGPILRGRVVYDLGAGDLGHSHALLRCGADRVVAIDKEAMPKPRSPRVTAVQSYFDRVVVPDRVDVAFVGWPQNRPLPGLLNWLDAADVVIYLGHNFDGSSCGNAALFGYFTTRQLVVEVPGRRNSLLVMGERMKKLRALTPEEAAHFSAEVVQGPLRL
jgi:hypothetical protein